MIDSFIKYLKAQVGHAIYVWGGQGQTNITEKWIRAQETSEANAQRALKLWKALEAKGVSPIAAYDCSGLIMHYLQDQAGFFKNDLSSAGLYGQCTPVERSALKRGDLVFRHNGTKIHHVGVYVGDNTVIEAQGRDVGVVQRDLNAGGTGYWNRYGRLPLPEDAGEEGTAYFATVDGGSVNVRKGAGSQTQALGVAHKGDPMLAMPGENGWCPVAAALDGKLVSGYMAEQYVKREQ